MLDCLRTWRAACAKRGRNEDAVGSGGTSGLLRNLDRGLLQEGLNHIPVSVETFPLDDADGTQLDGTCSYGTAMVTSADIADVDAYFAHVAEGIDAYAENEAVCLSDENPAHDVTVDKSAFVHAVGLTAADLARLADNGTSLIWSPRSNIRLYGDTAVVAAAARLGVPIALGSDWLVTGSMNLLRELRCADSFNQTYLQGFFSDEQLWQMVTSNAARAAAMDDVIGSLDAGKVADIAVFNEAVNDAHRAVIAADPTDVVLVMRGGRALYGDSDILSSLPATNGCDTIDVCGVGNKKVCLQNEIGKSYSQLQDSVGGIYPAFQCGTPTDEPTCTPRRSASSQDPSAYDGIPSPSDSDGDGIPDTVDSCPTVFNPVRPLDGGAQADADADGKGDACDACPAYPNPGAAECPQLIAFDPPLSYVREGENGVPRFPTALTVTLGAPVSSDTFVAISSADSSTIAVVGGGVMVIAGQASAQVLVNALAQSPSVTLTASLGLVSLQSDVRVLGASEQPTLSSLTPTSATIAPGGWRKFTIGLDIPAPARGTTVNLALAPSGAGTLPATVTVEPNEATVAFDYVDGATDTSMTIYATLNDVTLSATVMVAVPSSRLVINEIDYDQIGTDTAEYVEIYNGTGAAVNLNGMVLSFVNGSVSAEYAGIDLSPAGTLLPDHYFVVGGSAAVALAPPGELTIDLGSAGNYIQNGAPDGVALIDTVTQVLVDALSYEGAISAATVTGLGTVSLIEGTLLSPSVADSNTVSGSLARLPNGADTDDAAADWAFTSTITPGAPNVP